MATIEADPNAVLAYYLVFFFVGIFAGALMLKLFQFLAKLGRTRVLELSQKDGKRYTEKWVRIKGGAHILKRKDRKGLAPLPTDGVFAHHLTGRPLLLVDGDSALVIPGLKGPDADAQAKAITKLREQGQILLDAADQKEGATVVATPVRITPSDTLSPNGWDLFAFKVDLRWKQVLSLTGLDLAQIGKYAIILAIVLIGGLFFVGVGTAFIASKVNHG